MVQHKIVLVGIVLCQIFLNVDCVRGPEDTNRVKGACIACICDASSNCSPDRFGAGGMQGSLRITMPYWIDAGQPVLDGELANSPNAFENCAHDGNCARKTVRGYMARYAKDCNGDGKIDCDDYAAIHKMGPLGCHQDLPEDYRNLYMTCKEIFQEEKNIIL